MGEPINIIALLQSTLPKRKFPFSEKWMLEKVAMCPMSGCWLWLGTIAQNGYGCFTIGNAQVKAHRAFFEYFVRPIPIGMLACHRCDNRACVNPFHIYPGTALDNASDMVSRGRQARNFGAANGANTRPDRRPCGGSHGSRTKPHRTARGERLPQTRLKEADVLEIRRCVASGALHKDLARRYGVSRATITLAANGDTWAHVGGLHD